MSVYQKFHRHAVPESAFKQTSSFIEDKMLQVVVSIEMKKSA